MISRRRLMQLSGLSAASLSLPYYSLAKLNDGFIELTAKKSTHHLEGTDKAPSELWTYNGSTPGPEIRVKRGERVKVRLINELEEATSIHWHGIRIDNTMDGVSGLTQQAVKPGETFDYDFVVPDAGTYWYHAHNKSWNQVGRGLYGPLIVEENELSFDQEHDLTLVIDDWRLDDDGALHTASFGALHDWSHAGRLGNFLTVNGVSLPTLKLNRNEAYRIRLINVSNARILTIDAAKLNAKIIALDGQALPVSRDGDESLSLAPAQRADLLLVPDVNEQISLEAQSRRGAFEFARFEVIGDHEASSSNSTPTLKPNTLPEPVLDGALIIPLVMTGGAMGGGFDAMIHQGQPLRREDIRSTRQMWAFNNIAGLAEEPLFEVGSNKTIVIEMMNDTAFPHAMHVHGHHFRLLTGENNFGDWRDTVLVQSDTKQRIAFVADNPGSWLLHCHMLEHAAAGMRTWFKVS